MTLIKKIYVYVITGILLAIMTTTCYRVNSGTAKYFTDSINKLHKMK